MEGLTDIARVRTGTAVATCPPFLHRRRRNDRVVRVVIFRRRDMHILSTAYAKNYSTMFAGNRIGDRVWSI